MKRGIVEVLTKTTAFVALSFTDIANAKTPVDAVARQGSGIIRTFMAAVRACDARPSVTPNLIVKTQPDLVSYSSEDNSVHLSRWNDLPPQVKELVTAWSKQSTLNLSPSAMFSEIFNSLLVPHELGHYLQTASARSQKLDHWQSETEANQIAIAFWSRTPDGKRTIGQRVANFEKFLGKLPSPVPAGADPHAYFESNYKKLSSDAAAYGWYQGAFMRTAWASRNEHDFCGWVKLNKQNPNVKPKW